MKRKKKRKSSIVSVMIKMITVLVAMICVIFVLNNMRKEAESNSKSYDTEASYVSNVRVYRKKEVNGQKYKYNTDIITVLCLGIDAQNSDLLGQSDALALLVFDRGEKRMKVIGISRDSMVPIRVFDALGSEIGWDRQHLALAYANGRTKEKGSLLAQEAVSKMFHDIPIIYYVAGNIAAISEFHDVIGEIVIQIDDEDKQYLNDDFNKGDFITLTSANVEDFVRFRDTGQEYSNEGRMRRQKLYVEAYLERLKVLLDKNLEGTILKMESVFSNAITNVGLNEITTFAEMALSYKFDPETDYYTVEGENITGKYHDEFLVDEKALEQMVLQIFYKKE